MVNEVLEYIWGIKGGTRVRGIRIGLIRGTNRGVVGELRGRN